MINMGNLSPLTGSNGEIRADCKRVNKGLRKFYAMRWKNYAFLSSFSAFFPQIQRALELYNKKGGIFSSSEQTSELNFESSSTLMY